MRFHQALSFLEADQIIPIAVASESHGYAGVYLSDHMFNPRDLESQYTYSVREDGAPGWEKDTGWPDPMCVFAAIAGATSKLTMTTGVYVAPARDLVTVAKSVGTTAVLSGNRVRLGVGVGWCKEEFAQTGQTFTNRGARLDEMIPALRALWAGGWVSFHGTHYDIPECQMNPSPSMPVPILGGGHSEPALRRTAALCDGWIAAGAYSEEEAWQHLETLSSHLARAGRGNEFKVGSKAHGDGTPAFSVYLSLAERPDVDLYRRFEDAGVTDLVCAPWMFAPLGEASSREEVLATRIGACEWFAEKIVAKMAA